MVKGFIQEGSYGILMGLLVGLIQDHNKNDFSTLKFILGYAIDDKISFLKTSTKFQPAVA